MDSLPDNAPNTPPADWSNTAAYCIAEAVPDPVYQLAAIWQMADRAQAPPAPELLALSFAPAGECTVHWSAAPGYTYHLEAKNNLGDPAWQLVGRRQATGSEAACMDPTSIGAGSRFYRVLAVQ
jgi:hypothetical protein